MKSTERNLTNLLAALSSRLSSHHSFDFLDGQFECPPAPGISELFPSPYLAWYSDYETQSIQRVHEFLLSVIEEDGPYDGIVGFSEGAAVAASLLLSDEQNAEMSGEDLKFKVAVFFNGVMVFSPSSNIGRDMTAEVRKQEEDLVYFLNGIDTPPMVDIEEQDSSSDYSSSPEEFQATRKVVTTSGNIFGFEADSCPSRISIPTLHFIGRDDQFAEHGRNLVKLCGSEMAEVMVFDGGHELPRRKGDLDTSAELFELVITLASVGGH